MALLSASNPKDESFLVTLADVANLAQHFAQTLEDIENSLLFMSPKGLTSLLDAIALAINNMKKRASGKGSGDHLGRRRQPKPL